MDGFLVCLVDGFSGVVSFDSPEEMDKLILSHVGDENWALIFDDADVEARIMMQDRVLGSIRLLGGGRFRFPTMDESESASCSFQEVGQI